MDLSNQIRALMNQIGLPEGATEEHILEKFKGKTIPHDDDDDEPMPEEMIDEEKKAPKKKKVKGEKVTPAPAAAPSSATKSMTQSGAKQTNSATPTPPTKPTKDTKSSKPAPLAPNATVATSKQAPISLSRPKSVKEESNSKKASVKTETDSDESTAPPAPVPSFPLNKPTLPGAPAPSTLPRDIKTEGLKWYQQAEHIVLPFPKTEIKTPAQGKKVNLAGSDASAASTSFVLPATVDGCFQLATTRYEQIVAHFETLNAGRSSDARWLNTVMSSGTLTDKIAGMTLMIQEAPLYRMGILDKLLAMAHKQGRRENTMAIDALKDLFLNDLLPQRKLIAFASQPFFTNTKGAHTIKAPTETQLVYWILEDALKTRYLDFLGILEEGTHDEMAYIKKSRINCIYELLLACPERERVLLSLLVNKLGDADKKVASKVVFYLTELVTKHPGFKLTLISELEQLLYRSNISKRAQYYAIIFLNQLVFHAGDEELANKLIHVYFLLFKQFIALNQKENDEEAAKLRKKLKRKKEREAKKSSTVKDTPAKSYGGSNSVSHKFDVKKGQLSLEASNALRSKLLGGLLTGINRALPYASISALEGGETNSNGSKSTSDANKSGEALVIQQIDMIFNLVHTTAFNTSVQALMLLYQALSRSILSGTNGPNIDRFYRALYDKLLAPELFTHGSRYGLFLNLLYKSMKSDTNSERLAAFTKRVLQISTQAQPNFVCGVLYLLSEISKTQPIIKTLISQPPVKGKLIQGKDGLQLEEDEDEEHFVDAPDEDDPKAKESIKSESTSQPKNGEADKFTKVKDIYDPFKREPQFARASSTCLWEILFFTSHFHPSVIKFANDLAAGIPITYTGDPLKDFTSMNFLDRFVYKNPKQTKQTQPTLAKQASTFGRPSSGRPYSQVNTPAFLQQATAAGTVSDELQFFHKYFATKAVADEKKQARKEKELSVDATEEEEDAFADDIIEREMKRMDPDSWMDDEEPDEDGEPDSDDDEEGEPAEFDGEMDDEDIDMDEADGEVMEDAEDDDDEAAAEAAALAEMEGGAGGDDSEEEEMSDEDGDKFNFDEDDDEDDDDDGRPAGRDRNASVFASAEEFADLLNSANDTGKSAKQSVWEKQRSIETARDQPKGGKGLNRSKGGYKPAPAPSHRSGGNNSLSKKKGGGSAAEKPSFKSLKRKQMESKGASSKKKGGKGKKQKH